MIEIFIFSNLNWKNVKKELYFGSDEQMHIHRD
jgi:hypothetical protein